MFDLSKPVENSLIFITIGIIILLTIFSIYLIKIKEKKTKDKS